MVIEKDLVENAAAQAALKEIAGPVEHTGPACRHHWVIEPANGPVSRGECQVCHESREFQNSIGDGDRGY